MDANNTVQYRKAKPWQLYLFSVHDLLLICFILTMNFITYLGAGYYGLLATTVAMIATASRIFDAITDPIIAFIVERTDGKFGRYRPMMVLGWIISAIAVLCMYFFCVGANVITFILIYAVYVIGYSFMMTAQGGARVAFTNEPVQRNRMGLYMGILTSLFTVSFSFYNTNYLVPKHGGKVDLGTMQELAITMLVLSFIILVITVFSLRGRDVPENYRSLTKEKVTPADMFKIMKGNRNFQMILVACASDRIATNIAGNTSVIIAVWGIIAGNYAFYGKLSLIVFIPNILVAIFGNQIAIKMGKRTALRNFSIGSVISACLIIALFVLGDPTGIGTTVPMTAAFLVMYAIYQACYTVTNGLRMPMLADVADYEMSRNGGKQVAGIVSAAYSLVDKVIVAFATTIVAFAYSSIGYVTTLPQIGDQLTGSLLAVSMMLWMGLPMLEMSAKDFRQVVDVDLNGPFIVSKAVIPSMIKKGGGKIINICSMMSELGRETVSAYAAAKGGLKKVSADENYILRSLQLGVFPKRNQERIRDMGLQDAQLSGTEMSYGPHPRVGNLRCFCADVQ